jgi:hypothetical protein
VRGREGKYIERGCNPEEGHTDVYPYLHVFQMVRDNTYITKLRINVVTNKDLIRQAKPFLMTNKHPSMEGLYGQNPFPRNVEERIKIKYLFLEKCT